MIEGVSNKESDPGHAGRPGQRGGSSPSGGTDHKAIAAGERRYATQAEHTLDPHEKELIRLMDENHPEIKTQVLKDGKMVDDGGEFNKW